MKIGDIVVVIGSESIPQMYLGRYGEVTAVWGERKVEVKLVRGVKVKGGLYHTANLDDLERVGHIGVIAEDLDWRRAIAHIHAAKRAYEEIGWAGGFALTLTINPLIRRYESGERTAELYAEVMDIKL